MGAAVVYSAYILVSDGVARRLAPRMLAALVCTGAAVTLGVGAALAGDFRPGGADRRRLGLDRVPGGGVDGRRDRRCSSPGCGASGPTSASILSTVEPLATVVLAFLIFGETLGALQLAGGTLVLAAAIERMTA